MSEQGKNDIFRDINYFVKMSVGYFIRRRRYQILCRSKTSVNIKIKFHIDFDSLCEIDSYPKGGGVQK